MSIEEAANELAQCERCSQLPVLDYAVRMCRGCFARATAKLSALQLILLRRANDAAVSTPLEHSEIPAANGLVARGLARTHRDGRIGTILAARTRYRVGTTRRMHLTSAGVAFLRSVLKEVRS